MRIVRRIVATGSGGSRRAPRVRVARPGGRARQNAIMMTVGESNPGARRARANRGMKAPYREYTIPLSQVNMTPTLKRAIERWEQFQDGAPAKRVRVYEYDDGKEGVDERVCFRVGEAQITVDTVEDESGREVRIKPLEIGMVYKGEKSAKNKKGVQWIHSFEEDGGKPPINVVDVETGIMMQLGGTYEAADWMRR